MKRFLRHRFLYIGLALIAIVVMVLLMLGVGRNNGPELVVTIVESGLVRQLVSVSGVTEAKQTASLAFPSPGYVESILVKVGDTVEAGDILLTMNTNALMADRQEALAILTKAKADKVELIAGPQLESRTVTSETVILKERALETTKETETKKVANALAALRSAELTAYTNNVNEDSIPPTVSGTYTCDTEGVYKIEMYRSEAQSGYSYRLSGLEEGTFTAAVEQPSPLGLCGLRILFDDESIYGNTTWYIEVPNTTSDAYLTYKNAYELAKTQAESAIALAEQDLLLAKATASNTNAPARSEAVIRADASIVQAEARLARIESELSDRTLRAPFSGTVTDLSIERGEIAASTPIITLLAASAFEMIARIPEIDIGKLAAGQKVEMVFDAKRDELVTGTITFISLQATEIDGVAYYEAYIEPDNTPAWMRSGLNADIDIIVFKVENTLRIPKRFVIMNNDTYSVQRQIGDTVATTTIEVTLEGNEGFVAITGLNAGDTVVAP
jgi:RND family efflux transporter MFP subunit